MISRDIQDFSGEASGSNNQIQDIDFTIKVWKSRWPKASS